MVTSVALIVVVLAIVGIVVGAGVGLKRRRPPPGFDVIPKDDQDVRH